MRAIAVAVAVLGAVSLASGCLDPSVKRACLTDTDCNAGRVCMASVCGYRLPDAAVSDVGTEGPPDTGGGGAAGTGGAPATGNDHTGPNTVFVTSATFPNRLQPLAAADDRCTAAAHAASLPGQYRAWLSTTAVDARDRLGQARGWVRADGSPFADTVDDIATGRIFNLLNVDERGMPSTLLADDLIMTGTNQYGLLMPGQNCDNWASDTQEGFSGGTKLGTTGIWTAWSTSPCGTPAHLFCFGVDHSYPVAPPAPPAGSKRAFVTEGKWVADGGLVGADYFCSVEAAAAGLSGTFAALLASATSTAASRFASLAGAVWFRVDGVPLNVAGRPPFGAPDGRNLIAPLNVTSKRNYLPNEDVWTGALQPGELGPGSAFTCSTDVSGDILAINGFVGYVPLWFGVNTTDCSARRLYCFER